MNEQASWEENNDKHLAATIAWIRLRLEQLAQSAEEDSEPKNKKKCGWFKQSKQNFQPVKDKNKTEFDSEAIELARQEMIKLEDNDPPPALILLKTYLKIPNEIELSKFDSQVLALCAAMELDTRIAGLCAKAQGDLNKRYPTFALAFALFDDPDWNALSPHGSLRHWRLLEINQPGAQPLTGAALAADERIVNYLKGLNYLDDRLTPLLDSMGIQPIDEKLPLSQQQKVDSIIERVQHSNGLEKLPVIELLGHDSASKRLIAGRVASSLGLNLHAIDIKTLPSQTSDFETFTRLWQRESLLMPLALYIDIDGTGNVEKSQLKRFLERSYGIVFLDLEDAKTETVCNRFSIEINKPTPEEQEQLWTEALHGKANDQPQRLAEQFSFSQSEINRLAKMVLDEHTERESAFGKELWQACRIVTQAGMEHMEDAATETVRNRSAVEVKKTTQEEQEQLWKEALQGKVNDLPQQLAEQFSFSQNEITRLAKMALVNVLWQACRIAARAGMEQLARRIDVKADWNQLVLPSEQKALLQQITDQVAQRNTVYEDWGFREQMNRGLGINALFAGESGTGKTMAAEVIANKLELDLYRIDLSAVVSKYIGETEKNLRKLFDAAEDSGAILFFDEADALFGKRSEIKDSHDRYANIEINYLLQRMESYRGLAILATNMKGSLDKAFMRRLRFIVDFPFPGAEQRKEIWQKVFPSSTPVDDDLDYDRLARLNLTGGSILNIALNAAFLAAQRSKDKSVTMPLLLNAARTEFKKLERPAKESDFRWLISTEAK